MKKNYIVLLALVLFFSCKKESSLSGSESNGDLNKKLDSKKVSVSSSPGSCYDDFLVSNFNYIRQASSFSYPDLLNSFLAASIKSNEDGLNTCGTVIFADSRKIRNLQEVPALPGGPVPSAVYTDPTDILNFLRGTYYMGSKNYFEILIEALDYANATNVAYTNHAEKMLAIAKAIHDLGYDGIYLSQGYHGDYDPTESYIYHGIEILSGKYAMTSDFYNAVIAKNASEYVSYPIVKYSKGFTLMAKDDYVQSESTGPFYPVTVSIQIAASTNLMYYVTDLSTLMPSAAPGPTPIGGPGTPSPEPNQTSVYYQSSTDEFFTNSSMTSYVPNGYYFLPSNHANEFQKNNYLIEIENGKIKKVLGI